MAEKYNDDRICALSETAKHTISLLVVIADDIADGLAATIVIYIAICSSSSSSFMLSMAVDNLA
jgi:hypothetical protein